MRALILTNNVAPYRNLLFSKVSGKLGRLGWNVYVLFMRERETLRSWEVRSSEMKYQHEILSGVHFALGNLREIHFNPSLWRRLVELNPDVLIIGGYSSISCWVCLLYGKLYKKRVIMWSGSILTSSTLNQRGIKALRRLFIKSCDAFITYGTKAREFLEHYGAGTNQIFTGCNVGDIEFFRTYLKAQPSHDDRRGAQLVFVGRLVRDKGIFNLIEALLKVGTKSWHLTVLGDGPERKILERICYERGLADRVTFAGFKQKEELAAHYNASDIFVLPSFADKFSIVLSEALASGLFVIASRYDGASFDIVREGVNGCVTDPHDVDALAGRLQDAITRYKQLPAKQAISDSIAHCMDHYAQQFVRATQYVMN